MIKSNITYFPYKFQYYFPYNAFSLQQVRKAHLCVPKSKNNSNLIYYKMKKHLILFLQE